MRHLVNAYEVEAGTVVFHEEALYQVYLPLPLPLPNSKNAVLGLDPLFQYSPCKSCGNFAKMLTVAAFVMFTSLL